MKSALVRTQNLSQACCRPVAPFVRTSLVLALPGLFFENRTPLLAELGVEGASLWLAGGVAGPPVGDLAACCGGVFGGGDAPDVAPGDAVDGLAVFVVVVVVVVVVFLT